MFGQYYNVDFLISHLIMTAPVHCQLTISSHHFWVVSTASPPKIDDGKCVLINK